MKWWQRILCPNPAPAPAAPACPDLAQLLADLRRLAPLGRLDWSATGYVVIAYIDMGGLAQKGLMAPGATAAGAVQHAIDQARQLVADAAAKRAEP